MGTQVVDLTKLLPRSSAAQVEQKYIDQLAWATQHLNLGITSDSTWAECMAIISSIDQMQFGAYTYQFIETRRLTPRSAYRLYVTDEVSHVLF